MAPGEWYFYSVVNSDSPTRIALGPRSELDSPVHTVRLTPERNGIPRQALLIADESGVLRAYLNRCKHLPIPLDGGSGSFLDPSGCYLLCNMHGALYTRDTGTCIAGPCQGASLKPLPLEVDSAGRVWLLDS